jgi:hypothetical protein
VVRRAALAFVIALAACSFPPLADTDGGSGSNHGSGHNPDGGSNDGQMTGGSCSAPSDYGTPTASSQDAVYYSPSNVPAELDVAGVIKSGSPGDYLEFALVAETPPITSNDVPSSGTWTLDSTNLATCGVCGMIFTASTNPLAQSGNFNTMYVATSGSITYSGTSSNATATITNATFAQAVYTDPNNSNDLTTQLVAGGCTTKVDSVSFNVPVSNGQ